MQLVLLMTNVLLFPREHLHTQQSTELGLLHRDIQTLLWGSQNSMWESLQAPERVKNQQEVLPGRICAAHGGNFQLLAAFWCHSCLCRGHREKVPVTAAAPGFLSQGPHDMSKDICLTRKEKNFKKSLLFASQPLQRRSPWPATKNQQHKHLQDPKKFTGTADILYFLTQKSDYNSRTAALPLPGSWHSPLWASPKSPLHPISLF